MERVLSEIKNKKQKITKTEYGFTKKNKKYGGMSMEKYEEKNYKVYRFCDGEIVDGLNRKHYNPQKEDDMQCICTILNAQIHELNKLQKENKKLQGKYDKQLWIYNNLTTFKIQLVSTLNIRKQN